MNLFLYMYLFTALACNHEIQHLYLFIYLNEIIRCEKTNKKDFGFGSGSGSKFNCAARVGSGRVRRSRVRAGFGLQFKARADL